MNKTILFITENQGFINTALENKLHETGFSVTTVPDSIDEIHKKRHLSDMILFFLEKDYPAIERTMEYLASLCLDEKKSLSVIGDRGSVSFVENSRFGNFVIHAYTRPVDAGRVADDMNDLANRHIEFERTKKILVIDDDADFLIVMQNRLKNKYTVEGIRSSKEALFLLEHGKRPDLILLDYEMPELDGYEVMDKIHRNPLISEIPIIFLTGKNDRESVMRIIRHKPDGYLLKTMKKTELLDTLDRFFAETILYGA